MRASTLSIGLTIYGAGSVVRGIGVQRYATPVPDKGALRALAPDMTLENVVVRDNATQGIYVGGREPRRPHHPPQRHRPSGNGMLGIESSYSDGLVIDASRVTGNNTERFNQAPVSGGVKISRARDLTRDRQRVRRQHRPRPVVRRVGARRDRRAQRHPPEHRHGISYEISSQALIADNLVAGNGGVGMKINNASRIEIWNNTVVDNAGRPLWVVQDSRVASNRCTPGHDPRQPLPDPTVTWLLGPVTISNNVVGGPTSATCLLCAQDTALAPHAGADRAHGDGNLWTRPSATQPATLATWPTGSEQHADVRDRRGADRRAPARRPPAPSSPAPRGRRGLPAHLGARPRRPVRWPGRCRAAIASLIAVPDAGPTLGVRFG